MFLLILAIPFVGYALMLVAARSLARANAPDPPRDGTSGPWCLACRYSLFGVSSNAPCPECGRGQRFDFPSESPRVTAWVCGSVIASLLSHAPLAVAWLAHRWSPPMMYSVLVLQAFVVGAAMLILASRLRGRPLLWALCVMTIPNLIIESAMIALAASSLGGGIAFALASMMLAGLGSILMPAAFITYACAGMRRARVSRNAY